MARRAATRDVAIQNCILQVIVTLQDSFDILFFPQRQHDSAMFVSVRMLQQEQQTQHFSPAGKASWGTSFVFEARFEEAWPRSSIEQFLDGGLLSCLSFMLRDQTLMSDSHKCRGQLRVRTQADHRTTGRAGANCNARHVEQLPVGIAL